MWTRLRAEMASDWASDALAVARWIVAGAWSFRQGNPRTGYWGPDRGRRQLASVAARLAVYEALSAEVHCRDLGAGLPPGLPLDLDGAIVYVDPPYLGTTGYRHDLARAAVLDLARDAADRGAAVYISEAEPLEALGWEAIEITDARRGAARTFSRQQREWLTFHRPARAGARRAA